jgi:hypothetical protein
VDDFEGGEFVFQFDDNAFGGFATDAGNAGELSEVAGADGRDEIVHGHAAEDFESEAGADAGSGKQQFEKVLLAGGEEAIEEEGVVADVRVDEEGGFGVEFGEGSEGRERDEDLVADAGDIEEDLIRAFLDEASAKVADHGWGL